MKNSVTDTTDFGCSGRMQKKSNSGISHMSEQFLFFKQCSKDVLYAKHHTFIHVYVFLLLRSPHTEGKMKNA